MIRKGSTVAAMAALLVTLLFSACASSPAQVSLYKDGVYRASAEGLKGVIEVSVTIKKGSIKSIEVISHGETASLVDPVFDEHIKRVLERQSSDVDAVGGATYAEDALKKAIQSALDQAAR